MISTFFRLILLLGSLSLPAWAAAPATHKTTTVPAKHTAPKPDVALAPASDVSQDWQLPSFVAMGRTPASQAPAFPAPTRKQPSLSSNKPAPAAVKKEETASTAKSSRPSTKMEAAGDTTQPTPAPRKQEVAATKPPVSTSRKETAASASPSTLSVPSSKMEASEGTNQPAPSSLRKETAASTIKSAPTAPVPRKQEVASTAKPAVSQPAPAGVPTSKRPLTAIPAPSAKKETAQAPSTSKPSLTKSLARDAVSTVQAAKRELNVVENRITGRLARLTAYWAGEGDYYTGQRLSSTGIRLHGGHCAVDPSIIPYGSVVEIPGVGQFLAVDTGSAVISREAAREAGHNSEERGALVIDLFFEHRSEGEAFAAGGAKFVSISWWTPNSTGDEARHARSVFADEDWNKIDSKQL